MDREWMYVKIDDLERQVGVVHGMLDTQTRLIEDLNDRVASLEECARLAPTRAVRRMKPNKKESHETPPSLPS